MQTKCFIGNKEVTNGDGLSVLLRVEVTPLKSVHKIKKHGKALRIMGIAGGPQESCNV